MTNSPITLASDRRQAELRSMTFAPIEVSPRPTTKSGRRRTTRRRKTIR